MYSFLQQTGKWWLLTLLLVMTGAAQAQTGTGVTFKSVLDGSQGQLVPFATANVEDSVYFDPSQQSKLVIPYDVRNVVTFKINEYSNLYLPAKFTATVNLHVIFTLPDMSVDSVEKTLVIDYDTAATYALRNSFVFNSSHRVTVRIMSVTSDAGSGVLNALMLENELQAWPVYNLSCTADAVTSIGSPNPPPNVDTTDEIAVQWTAIKGADEYDLEWAYIDSTALLNNRYGNPVDPQLIFENNASRVTVKDNTYRIPLLYDNGGVLYYRVRAVQQKGNARVETAWSSNNLSGGLGVYNFCGHQRNLNWQSSISFAEEGKRKAVVQYYDGSLRSRQTVTKDNSTNTTLVSESFYDYQGRPVVTVLPAPTLSNVIKYTQNFNRGEDANGNGIEYDKDQYDHMDDPSEFLSASAKPMSKYYGASKYYSDQTPNKEEGLNSYIPDAGKYAFTETSYTQDNTNRISRQGGVGPTYKLGSNHETKYYYGTAAQKELDALFGTEVGDETHYFKNMVRDANGQYAVTYMDMHGRTIATALAGDPDSAQLAALPSNVPFSVTDTLSGPGKNQINDLVIERTKPLQVAVESDYNFHYELTPPVLHKEGCTTNQCYKALYNLEITITDDSYNQLLGGQPFDTTISVSGPFVADCGTPPSPIVVDFTLPGLKKGSYNIVKRLTISREGMEYYRDNIFLADNTCKTLDQFIQEQRELLLTSQCTPSCKSCTDSIGTWDAFRVKYMDRAGITEDTAVYRGEAMAAYQAAVAACNELCNATSQGDDIRKSMLLDVSAPSGQYANVENQESPYSIFYQPPGNAVATYRRGDITYLDEAGNPDMVYTELGDKYVKPQDLAPEQFAAAFKDSWAPALLPFHPEYCKLLELEKHSASNLWDKKFEAIDTYAEAKEKGYLNPTGRLTDEFANFTPPPVADQDPLSKESGALKQQLEDRMRTFSRGYDERGYQVIYTIWSAATATTKCPGDNTACTRSYQPVSEAFNETKLCAGDLDMAWRSFRQYYLQAKRDIINGLVSNASCGAAQGSVPADRLQADGKHPNFNNAIDALNQNGLNYMTSSQTTKEQAQAKGQEELNKYYEDNCVAYSKAWAQQLAASCPYYNQAALDVIIPKLIMVCKEGSDLNHTNGASSVRPASTYTYRSFADVIAEYNQQHGITDKMICNAEVITSPKPYDRQPVYGVKTTYSKPEDCECSKLNILHTEFLSLRQPADSNFSAYLLRTRKVKVLQSVLVKLLAACNEPAGSCNYLSEPLGIPGFMQCYTAPACATCQVVDSLYENFYTIYGVRPTLDEADTTKRNINQLFASFMNNRLGFGKQAWEYIRFVDSCDNVTSKDTSVCEPTLQLVKNYSGGTAFISDVIRTADNGYLLAGSNIPGSTSSFSTMTSNPMGGKEAYLIKTDSKGVLQWSRIYGGTEDDEFVRIKPTSDGGYIAIGTTKSGARAVSTRDAFIVKLTAEGNVTWSRAIGFNTTSGETGNDIVETPGGYAFTGGYDLAGGTADWLVGALTADGNVRWMKRMGSTTSDPYLVLMPKGDTLVFAGATTYYGSEYNAIVMKMNGNTGQYLSGMRYDIENGSTRRSNWVGTIFKTANGYRIPVLTADDFDSDNGNNNILDITDNLNMISVKKLGAPVSMGGLIVSPTADGGSIVSQVAVQSPGDVYLHKITPGNTIAWSNQVRLDGNEKVYQLLENADGSFVGAGTDDNNAMLMFPLSNGQTGCQDSALNVTYTDVATTPDSYVPQRSIDVSSLDMSIALGMQTYSPVESVVRCHGFDSCYKMNNGPLLCGNADAVFTEVFPDTINQCTDNEFFAINKGTALYNVYRDSLKNSFEQDYINTALKAADLEKFTVNYQTREYHYTLYYYDQAGNLVKTVPPAGVVVDRSDAWLNDVKAARAEGRSKVPAHTLVTRYRYNTLNQVVAQITPDAGISRFWYDRLGRLAVSQNAKQLAASPDRYSYTLYDALGRITEVGEISSATAMTDNTSRSETALSGWITAAGNSKTQITRTVYDLPHSPLEGLVWDATNLRNRVSWTGLYSNNADLQDGKRVSGTFYSYDILGNVNMLLQDYNLGPARDSVNRFKKIVYDYDLVSGKVNKVSYQPGMKDAFYHRYNYDAENRLTNVETSADGIYWENDAYYQYYKHGPLARTVLGQQQVQGLDYAYTLQGWLKGVNSTNMTVASDMGHDGATGGITARDAFGFALHYFGERDYKPVGSDLHPFADAESAGNRFSPLFNGNIAMMSVNLPKVGEPLLYSYGYDVLNRLVKMDASRNLNTTTNNWEPITLDDYQERVSYDANGNILTYNRNGDPAVSGKPADMDRLTYTYKPNSNKLDYIADAGNTQYDNDIKNQSSGNYDYDEIGNLIKDDKAGIKNVGDIEWTVYGKIKKIVKTNQDLSQTTITYDYDPAGNRISKNVNGHVTRYVRDASGNVMSVYQYGDPNLNGGKVTQTETHLYGSSRLGISTRQTEVETSLELPTANLGSLESTSNITFVRDQKFFELGNHLGNVLATVSDVKKARSEDGSTIDHFDADLVSAQDYYPFGMLEPGRSWNIGNYRYGFNGKENDNEVKGDGNSVDFGARVYDPRIARFFSTDPLESKFPWQSTYVYAADNPIRFIDVDGKGPGDKTKLYTNTNSADLIAKGGFNATTFGKYSRYNWFSTTPNQGNTGRANTGVTLTVEGIDVSQSNVITEEQTSAWEAESLKEMGYTEESFSKLTGKQRSAARSEVLGRMYGKVGEYMNKNAKDIYYLARDKTYAISDNYLNFYGEVTGVSGPNSSELIKSFSRQPLGEESAAALKSFGRASQTIRWGGRAALAIMVAKDVYEIYESNYSTRIINNKIGAWGAAIPAATYGAEFGSVAGPIGSVVGGVLFGGAGYIIGETATNMIQEYIFSKGVKY